MAALWNILRQEVRSTVDDFREKGAIGAMKDAVLDTKDLATSIGGGIWDGVKNIVTEGEPVLHAQEIPIRGAVCPLELPDGQILQATVVEVDAVSDPPRARVAAPGLGEMLLVTIQLPEEETSPEGDAQAIAVAGANPDGMSLLDAAKQDWNDTVRDFREKGAVGFVKDAALDAVDLVGSTATSAVDIVGNTATSAVQGARSFVATEEEGPANASAETGVAAGDEAKSMNLLDLFDPIKQEFSNTVALDAADLVGSTAKVAVNGAKSIANPLLESMPTLDDGSAAQGAGSKDATEAGTDEQREGGGLLADLKEPVEPPSDAQAKKSLVAMRRAKFEADKKKEEESSKKEEESSNKEDAEELID